MGLPQSPIEPEILPEPAALEPPGGEWRYAPGPLPRSAWRLWGRNLLLFLLTALSVYVSGVEWCGPRGAVRLVVGLLSIMVAHEMGHYLACVYYGVDATLPFFIPFPYSMVGTLGAFIRIRSRFPHRRALFDIGVLGPLAGFVVCLPVLALGVLEAQVVPLRPEVARESFLGFTGFLGEPLIFQWAVRLLRGPLADGMTTVIGPLGMAGWFGLLLTGLNLMPIGQLDGGHVSYALLREKALPVSRIASWVCVALIYFGLNWLIWAVLVRVLGRRHPPTTDDDRPIGRARLWLGLVSLIVFAVCFVPDPIVFSWKGFFRDVGLGRLLG